MGVSRFMAELPSLQGIYNSQACSLTIIGSHSSYQKYVAPPLDCLCANFGTAVRLTFCAARPSWPFEPASDCYCSGMIGARAASVVSDGIVLVLTALRTLRRVHGNAVGHVIVLKQILLRDSKYYTVLTNDAHDDQRYDLFDCSYCLLWVSSDNTHSTPNFPVY